MRVASSTAGRRAPFVEIWQLWPRIGLPVSHQRAVLATARPFFFSEAGNVGGEICGDGCFDDGGNGSFGFDGRHDDCCDVRITRDSLGGRWLCGDGCIDQNGRNSTRGAGSADRCFKSAGGMLRQEQVAPTARAVTLTAARLLPWMGLWMVRSPHC